MRFDQEMMNGSDVIEWIRLSMRSGIDNMPKDIADVMENAIRCIEDVWCLGGPSSPFASYRFWHQVVQYFGCIRDSFPAMLRGEDRGTKMLHMYAYRIMELHDTLVELIETEKKERDYMRSEKQARLDRMLQERGMRRLGASEAPYTMGDCMFDSVSFKLKEMGMPMSSMDIRRAAMRQLKNDYASGRC